MSKKENMFNKIRSLSYIKTVYFFFVPYTITLFTLIFFTISNDEIWKTVALIIGAIYVYIAGYYYYDNILLPYKAEEISSRNVENAAFDPFKKRNKTFFWMMRWVLPALAIQLFIFAGFFFAIQGNILNGSAFTHPYQYGEVYERWTHDFSQTPVTSIEKLSNKSSNTLANKQPETIERALEFIYIFKTEGLIKAFLENCNSIEESHNSGLKSQDTGIANDCSDYIISTIREGADPNNRNINLMLVATIESQIFMIPYIIAFTFSFLGTVIYTVKEVAFRLYTKDLYPNSLVNFIIRFLMAPSVSMVIAYFWMDDWPSFAAPMTFFIVGFFPQIAMQFIETTAEKYIGSKKDTIVAYESLMQLQGMTEYLAYRFKEIGVGNAQNLAYIDLPHLDSNIGYGRRLLVDLVAQALLFIHFHDDFQTLRRYGFRNIITFRSIITTAGDSKDAYMQDLADKSKIPVELIQGVYHLVSEGILKERVDTLEKIANTDESDQMRQLSQH